MIDYLEKFASEDDAKADPVVGAYFVNGAWRDTVCVPGVKVWDSRLDVAGTDADGNPIITHQFMPYWYVMIASDVPNDTLLNAASCALAVDWSGPTVLKSDIPINQIAFYQVSPVIEGRNPQALIALLSK